MEVVARARLRLIAHCDERTEHDVASPKNRMSQPLPNNLVVRNLFGTVSRELSARSASSVLPSVIRNQNLVVVGEQDAGRFGVLLALLHDLVLVGIVRVAAVGRSGEVCVAGRRQGVLVFLILGLDAARYGDRISLAGTRRTGGEQAGQACGGQLTHGIPPYVGRRHISDGRSRQARADSGSLYPGGLEGSVPLSSRAKYIWGKSAEPARPAAGLGCVGAFRAP